jgi:hypothetical protein
MEPNPRSVRAMTLIFKDKGEAVLRFTLEPGVSDTTQLEFLVGLEGVPRLAPGRYGLPVACKGAWKSPDTFAVEIDEVANINHFRLELTFAAGRLEGKLAETTGLGSIAIRGKLE